MVRVLVGLTAWLAGTAAAVTVAWFGANTVLSTAGIGPGAKVVITAPATPPTTASPASVPPSPSEPAHPAPQTPAATTHAPAPPPAAARTSSPRTGPTAWAGTARSYVMTGGRVTLDVTATSVTLVSAVPDASWAVQTWSGTDWLRVDFSSGSGVSSLIASWYEHPPSIIVTNGQPDY